MTDPKAAPQDSPKRAVPRSIKVAVGILAVEALAPGFLAAWDLIDILSGKAIMLSALLAQLALWLGAALWVAFTAKRLYDGRAWARSAAVFWQLVQLSVAWGSFTGQFANWWIGGALILTSLAVFVFVLSRESLAYTAREI
ncbi:MAG: hypothetical protein KGL77_01730 [Actinomycetales bacterium]|nr:hypothetical protein [Actinomycetales bacterium]